MELTRDLEEKGPGNVNNPNGWLQTAVKRETGWDPKGGGGGSGSGAVWQALPQGGGYIDDGVVKRCKWLSYNVFGGAGAIDEEAVSVLSAVGFAAAMDICKKLEET